MVRDKPGTLRLSMPKLRSDPPLRERPRPRSTPTTTPPKTYCVSHTPACVPMVVLPILRL